MTADEFKLILARFLSHRAVFPGQGRCSLQILSLADISHRLPLEQRGSGVRRDLRSPGPPPPVTQLF